MDHGLRRKQLAARLPELEVDGLVVTHPPNVRYLSGFTGSNGQLLVTLPKAVFFTDGRYTEQGAKEAPDLEQVTYPDRFRDALVAKAGDLGVERLAFESEGVTFRFHQELAEVAPNLTLVPTRREVEALRWTKEPEEVQALDRAQDVTDAAFAAILDRLREEVTEQELAWELEVELHRAGADAPAFDAIVAFGENSSEPHHEPAARALGRGDVVKLDFGAAVNGYHADMTRTVSFGEPPRRLAEAHDLVRRAQQAGIDAVRPGATGAEVDAAARSVIEGAGLPAYPHGLGHGVGLEVHEGPALRRGGEDVLPPRAVVTVEPGIYLPGLGGVRIEDMVEVREDGCRVLGQSSRELLVLT